MSVHEVQENDGLKPNPRHVKICELSFK